MARKPAKKRAGKAISKAKPMGAKDMKRIKGGFVVLHTNFQSQDLKRGISSDSASG